MWETLDVVDLMNRREEATVAANAGSYQVPIGTPLRRTFPTSTTGYTTVAHPYLPRHESVEGDSEMAWALDLIQR